MKLNEAGAVLSRISRRPLRMYSTVRSGRKQNPKARSVIVATARAEKVLAAVRLQLSPGLVAFIGTSHWSGKSVQPTGCEIVVAKGESQFDILRTAQTEAGNYGMETEELIAKLEKWDRAHGIDIYRAESDTIEFRLLTMPSDMMKFCKALYKFCPDIVDQGTDTLEKLQQVITRTKQVFLWWD